MKFSFIRRWRGREREWNVNSLTHSLVMALYKTFKTCVNGSKCIKIFEKKKNLSKQEYLPILKFPKKYFTKKKLNK